MGITGESEGWGEMTPSLSQTWLGSLLLLVCLLASRSITEEVSEYCSHMIGSGHLQSLQRLIDSQMETSCQITFEFVDQEQLKDPVCYLKKAFLLVQDIMEDTMRFRDNTPNAIAIVQLQELSLRLKSCFTKDYEEHDKACVRTFYETPLQLLEKVKNVFNETKNLLDKDWNIFSKNCNNSFAECSGQDVVTKPDCNCLYPKAIPSSDPASVSPHQPLAPSMAPMAGLTWDDSEGTEGSSLLPGEQPLRTVDPGSAKQRPPRSTCQSLEPPETPVVKDSTIGGSPQPRPSVGAFNTGMEDILDSAMGTNWAPEEASGEASEIPVSQGTELYPSRPGGGSMQTEPAKPSNFLSASSPLPASAKGQQLADVTGTALPRVGPMRPTGQDWNHTPQKTDHPSALLRDPPEPGSPRTSPPRPQGLSNPSTLSAQPQLSRSHSSGSVLPLGELEGRRSTRDRRSPAEPEGGPASEGAAGPLARFNSVPLTDTGHERQREGSSSPQLQESVFHLLVPSVILVLLAVGGLLFYRRRRRSRQEPQRADSPLEQPEGSPLTQDEDRQVELPV
ncbi:macrophage colony-stimulating factor 1 isoform X1 [Theropithecus gelada]|uniref:macrophage colony-stimulating factor 1 isoform X1 n=2 Tax=Theropithecus gelada TaxID=9565 RepID=UPI000DC1A6BC|nr:macrophage colony-stimulating factor 1 isoform X1 [Theropithecus gelada]